MDVADTSKDSGKEVHQWECSDSTPDQKWRLKEMNEGATAPQGTTPPSSGAMCIYKHKEETKGGKKGETNFFDAAAKQKSCDASGDWKTSCKDGDGKTNEVACAKELPKPSAALCQYKHKKDTAGGKQGQTTALDAFGKQKSCDKNADWKTACKDGNGDTDEVDCK